MNTLVTTSKKFYSLQYIRGFAALAVLFFHLSASLNGVYSQISLGDLLFSQGYLGVDFFFVLSGFIICFSTEKENYGWGEFIIRRFFRIYPLLVICITTYYLVMRNYDLHYYFISVLGFNFNYQAPAPHFGNNVLPSAWSISYEIVFYFVFSIAMAINHKYRVYITIFLIFLLYLFFSYYFNHDFYLYFREGDNNLVGEHNVLYIFTSSMFFEFVYGMLIYLFYKYSKGFVGKLNIVNGYPIKVAFVLCGSYLFFFILSNDKDNFYWLLETGLFSGGVIASLFIILCVLYEALFKMPRSSLLIYLGEISYSLYISHMVFTDFIYHKFHIVKQNGVATFCMVTILCILIAMILHHTIEKPMISYSKKLVLRIKN